MTIFSSTGGLAVLVVSSIICVQSVLASDDSLAHAKDLYASAAYDEALAVLDKLQTEAPAAETGTIAEYRVFCLLALDRRDEARKNIEVILQDNPNYLPSSDRTSPRIQGMIRDVRRQLLPRIVLDRYAAAKAAFERKDPQAVLQFEDVLALMDDPDVTGVAALNDLRTVVTAFRDLTRALAAPPAPEPTGTVAAPQPQTTPARTGASAQASNVAPIYTSADLDVVPPVAQSQDIPRWVPTGTEGRQDFRGTLELLIDERGSVVTATMRQSVHPAYNQLLLRAAKNWKFTPARKQGVAVPYLKIVDVHLRPVS
jgi:tetratricopeptide (TPR) repeat protein